MIPGYSESTIVSSLKHCIEAGAIIDPDKWAHTYWTTAENIARLHGLARDEIAADIAEADQDNATKAAFKYLPEVGSD